MEKEPKKHGSKPSEFEVVMGKIIKEIEQLREEEKRKAAEKAESDRYVVLPPGFGPLP